MASGSFERPLPDPAEEKVLLGLSDLKSKCYQIAANTTGTLGFVAELKDGLLVLSAGDTGKRGLYIYGSTSTGAIELTTILAPTQSGLTVTASGNNIAITNGTFALFVLVLAFKGGLPTLN